MQTKFISVVSVPMSEDRKAIKLSHPFHLHKMYNIRGKIFSIGGRNVCALCIHGFYSIRIHSILTKCVLFKTIGLTIDLKHFNKDIDMRLR